MQALAIAAIAGGTGLSAYSTIQGGKEAAELGKVQQKQFEAEADAVRLAASEESLEIQKRARADIASGIATASVFGGLVGSNVVLLAEKARNWEMDARTTERNAEIQARSLREKGKLARYQGQLARRNARMRATADIAGTAGQMYFMNYYPKSKTTKPPKGSMGYALEHGGTGVHMP